ncbi:MAG: hypothetical protein ACRDH9_03235 [Actinomycetota bacterium]
MRRPGLLLTIAIAWIGVVAGHAAAYFLTYPSQGIRHVHLAVTGHSWLGLATASLIAVIPVIVLSVAIRSIRTEATWSGPNLALVLAAIQIPSFAVIETMERGWSVGQALSDPAVFFGLILQPLLAVMAAWVLELLRRTVRAIMTGLHPLARARPGQFPPRVNEPHAPRLWLLRHSRRRAPPALLYG